VYMVDISGVTTDSADCSAGGRCTNPGGSKFILLIFLHSKNAKFDVNRNGFRAPKCFKTRFHPGIPLVELTALPQTF